VKPTLVFHPVWHITVTQFHSARSWRYCYIIESKYNFVAHFVDLIKEGSTGIDSVEAFALEEIKRREKQEKMDRGGKKLPSDTSLHSL